MDVIYERCCGLDIHKRTVVACLIVPAPGGPPRKEVRTFGTMTEDILALGDWLAAAGCRHVAMESTGVLWKPLYNLLEGAFELRLANARHIKAVPGRKTDVRDCEWIADLLRHGLLPASFVPDRPQRELRELTRYRTTLVRERTAEVNRLQKTLEGANIKLAAVASDVVGVSGRQMLAALVAGTTDAAALAHLDFLDDAVARVSAEIAARLRPCAAVLERLDTIPGVGRRTAEVLVAELGTDMRRFRTARHLASWAGMCPGNHESAGKRKSGRTRKGSPWLRVALTEAAHAAARTKRDTYLKAQYRRLAARRGKQRAIVAVGHTLLVIVYHLLTDGTPYRDLGGRYFDDRDRRALERRLVHRLQGLGYRVSLEPTAA